MRKAAIVILLCLLAGGGSAFYVWQVMQQAADDKSEDSHRSTAGDELQLSVFISVPGRMEIKDESRDFVRKAIEEKFNVRLNVRYEEPGNYYDAQLTALLHANNAPDMWIVRNSDGGSKHTLDGVLADMAPYVSPLTMPNYFKYWETERELIGYQIHNQFSRAPVPYDKNAYRSYYIRKDWLDRLGLEIPATYEKYLDVLRAFTFRDPDGNGLDDTYGFSASGNGTRLSTDWPEYVKNGLAYPAFMENNRFVDMESDLRIGGVVDDIVRVLDEGVVDPDWFLNKGNEHIEKAVRGEVGVVLGETADFALDANPQSLQTRGKTVNPEANWVPFSPFGNKPLRTGVDPGYPFVFAKSTADNTPEKLVRMVEILDWLAGEEGFLLTHYGLEGEHYTRDGNSITLLDAEREQEIAEAGDFLSVWSFFTPEVPSIFGLKVVNVRPTDHDMRVKEFLASLPVEEKLGTALTPPIGIDEGLFRAKQNEFQVKMLFSERSGKNWPAYRAQIMHDYDGEPILQNFESQVRKARKSN